MCEIKVMNDDEIRDFCIKKDLKIFVLEREVERLNNIINELEKHLEHEIKEYKENGYDILEIRKANLWLTGCYDEDKNILNKLQELKGSDKE